MVRQIWSCRSSDDRQNKAVASGQRNPNLAALHTGVSEQTLIKHLHTR